MKARYAILDFDGVVADTESVFAKFDCALLNAALEQAGKQERLTIKEVRNLAGMSGENKLIHVAKKYGFDVKSVEKEFLETRRKQRPELFKTRTIDLGKNLSLFVENNRTCIALGTNKRGYKLKMDAAALNLETLFDIIVTCDPPLNAKPEPDILLEAAKQLNALPEHCLYVGDNPNDMIAAKAANMLPIGFIINGVENDKTRAQALRDSGAEFVYDDFRDIQNHMVNL